MIALYKGARGRGKTLTMVKDGYINWKKGFRVLRNFKCSFGEYISNEDILELDKDSDLRNCILMIDEIQIFFDSRNSMSKQNRKFSYFIQQSRKRNIHVLCTTQYSNAVEMRIRQHLDMLVFPSFSKKFNVCEVVYMDLTRLQDDEQMLNLIGAKIMPLNKKLVFVATPFFNLYNTEEIII